jgi:hypothetical protein
MDLYGAITSLVFFLTKGECPVGGVQTPSLGGLRCLTLAAATTLRSHLPAGPRRARVHRPGAGEVSPFDPGGSSRGPGSEALSPGAPWAAAEGVGARIQAGGTASPSLAWDFVQLICRRLSVPVTWFRRRVLVGTYRHMCHLLTLTDSPSLVAVDPGRYHFGHLLSPSLSSRLSPVPVGPLNLAQRSPGHPHLPGRHASQL